MAQGGGDVFGLTSTRGKRLRLILTPNSGIQVVDGYLS
jgi:hypothetical protein